MYDYLDNYGYRDKCGYCDKYGYRDKCGYCCDKYGYRDKCGYCDKCDHLLENLFPFLSLFLYYHFSRIHDPPILKLEDSI
ncbi:hypothetical protein RirG_010930 [Rhizophagus irregularis DAOM 197198w]|uniref:Uncharacterized protein n=1 Tax=Rhizophagus irregularis (strain DAOM 197198w) TaxID=1432141 RepID=A0A015NHJ2_RHIIW|nr:hypothetical protein RirG_010930 [Rhizophagus irregularis DAOM 197198w]